MVAATPPPIMRSRPDKGETPTMLWARHPWMESPAAPAREPADRIALLNSSSIISSRHQ